ncbi:MAG: 50S ribosomal protein L15 [Opitutales bacterium]
MRLNNIPAAPGANKGIKRLGRGHGSGHGKTSGRGHKGQRARSGASQRPGFESGHIPLYRRLPHRGFNNAKFRKTFAIVNVGDLARIDGDTVNADTLVAAGLIRASGLPVKVLGDGAVEKAYKVTADKVSASARAKIEAAGGSVTVTGPAAEPAEADKEEG